MEETEVIIVGAGPSGLILGLQLAYYQSIILEKELEVQEDPRGIVMTGDGVRSLYNIGFGQALADVSQEHNDLNFHLDSFKNAVYLKFPQNIDLCGQTLAPVVFMGQPKLERALRKAINESKYCQIRAGCEVRSRKEIADGVIVEYSLPNETGNPSQKLQQICAQWLVGADGKKGIVRKKFLEPVGIIQQVGKYEYTGTWIAANLQITAPTPETHPDLPLWKLGMSSEEVYEKFWPSGWHFCTCQTESIASGRFGPKQDRLWRHEFALEHWEDGMDAEKLFWNNLTPNITRDSYSIPGLTEPLTFPRDCIKVLRCRPFTFVQKVAGPTWHHNRTIIIGDAAHVFPPFGGQGIASGVRDAIGLAWRLAIFTKMAIPNPSLIERLLMNWFHERRQGIDQSADQTMVNGRLTNQKWRSLAYLQAAVGFVLLQFPWLIDVITRTVFRDDLGYKTVKDGFFLADHGGGGKTSQIFVQQNAAGTPVRSDIMLRRASPLMTVVILLQGDTVASLAEEARLLVEEAGLDPFILSSQSICVFTTSKSPEKCNVPTYTSCTLSDLTAQNVTPFPGYDETSFIYRLGVGTRFAILRPDNIIFCTCRSGKELRVCLESLKGMIT